MILKIQNLNDNVEDPDTKQKDVLIKSETWFLHFTGNVEMVLSCSEIYDSGPISTESHRPKAPLSQEKYTLQCNIFWSKIFGNVLLQRIFNRVAGNLTGMKDVFKELKVLGRKGKSCTAQN